jgi:hypothetical protein
MAPHTLSRAYCKSQCNCWFVEEEEDLTSGQDEELEMNSRICKWNNCFNACFVGAANRAACKTQCNCWFLEEEEENLTQGSEE